MDSMTFGKTMPVPDLPEEVTKQKQATFPPNLDTMIQNSKLNHAINDIISYLDIYNEIFNEAYQDLRYFNDFIKFSTLDSAQRSYFYAYMASLRITMEDVNRAADDLEKIAAQIPADNLKAKELINRLMNECVRVRTRGNIAINSMESFTNNESKSINCFRNAHVKLEAASGFDPNDPE